MKDDGQENQAPQCKVFACRHCRTEGNAVDQRVHGQGNECTRTTYLIRGSPSRRLGNVRRSAVVEVRQRKVFEQKHQQKADRGRHRGHEARLHMGPGHTLFKVLPSLWKHQEQRGSEERSAAERDHQRQVVEAPFPVEREVAANHAGDENAGRQSQAA